MQKERCTNKGRQNKDKQKKKERKTDRQKEKVKTKQRLIVTAKQCDGVIISKNVCSGQNFHYFINFFCPCQLLQNKLSTSQYEFCK
jgi:hypothetical protein